MTARGLIDLIAERRGRTFETDGLGLIRSRRLVDEKGTPCCPLVAGTRYPRTHDNNHPYAAAEELCPGVSERVARYVINAADGYARGRLRRYMIKKLVGATTP